METGRGVSLIVGVVGNVTVVVFIGIGSVLIRQLATPFQRGFFQDDQSLMYPFKKSTISSSVLYGVGLALPTLAIILIESRWINLHQQHNTVFSETKRVFVFKWLWIIYQAALMFFFGVVVTHFSTNVPKYTLGRLRPHFFAVCLPDWSRVNSSGYIEEDICTGNDTAVIKEARVSFPSGHSSMAVYTMLFLVLYLQQRLTWHGMVLLKPFLQLLCLLTAFYTCLSRIADYKHHWSDVLGGGLLGALIAVLVFWSLQKTCLLPPQVVSNESQGSLVQGSVSSRPSSVITNHLTTLSTAM